MPVPDFPFWMLKNRPLPPIVQGGMGIGVSAHRLAGNVARLGAVGTISSVDLRHHHADLLECTKDCHDKDELDRANLIALDREIRMALDIAAGHGAIAVNVMKAVAAYAAYVRQSCESGAHAIVMGAAAIQIGTPFAVTEESDAHLNFKQVLAEARPEDIVTFMSVAELPARAVLTPWLKHYLQREKALQSHAKADPQRCVPDLNCLTVCGLRDGIASIGQFCIDTRLAFALKGDVKKGLFSRDSENLPFGAAIRPVTELLDYFLAGRMPAFH